MKIEAQILSRFLPKQFGQSISIPPRLTGVQSTAVAQVEPPNVELSRAGRRFIASPGVVANAGAPVTDVPTTASLYTLWNGEADGGASYLIDALGAYLASGTAAVGATILCGVSTKKQAAAVVNSTGVVIASASGSARSSKGQFATGVTLTGAPAWFPIAGNAQSAGTTVGLGGNPIVLPEGMFVVPPGFCFCMTVLSGTGTTAKYSLGVVWSELELDLE